jgi:hypothetical protein
MAPDMADELVLVPWGSRRDSGGRRLRRMRCRGIGGIRRILFQDLNPQKEFYANVNL